MGRLSFQLILFCFEVYSFESSVVMGVVSKSGSGGISRICPPFPPTQRHISNVPKSRPRRAAKFDPVWRLSGHHIHPYVSGSDMRTSSGTADASLAVMESFKEVA
jgi:hypothetical protein